MAGLVTDLRSWLADRLRWLADAIDPAPASDPEASFSGYSVSSGSVNVSPSSYAVAHSESVPAPCHYRVVRERTDGSVIEPLKQGGGAECRIKYEQTSAEAPDQLIVFYRRDHRCSAKGWGE